MATFAAVITTSGPGTTQVYYTLVRGTAASPTAGTRTAMTLRRTVGARTAWEADVTWDNTWVNPRLEYDNGTIIWSDGQVIANVSQGNGSALIPEAGSGGDSCTLHFTNLGLPIADADVWVTADLAGAVVVAGTRQTDSSGNVTFLLNAGTTYYVWLQKDGEEPILGDEYVAVAD